MGRFSIFWLCLASFFLARAPLATGQDYRPVDAAFFLKSIEPEPSPTALYDFFDMFSDEFAVCRQVPAYITALGYMADNGENGFVLSRLEALAKCTTIPKDSLPVAQQLADRVNSNASFVPKPPTLTAETAPTKQPTSLAVAQSAANAVVALSAPVSSAASVASASADTPPSAPMASPLPDVSIQSPVTGEPVSVAAEQYLGEEGLSPDPDIDPADDQSHTAQAALPASQPTTRTVAAAPQAEVANSQQHATEPANSLGSSTHPPTSPPAATQPHKPSAPDPVKIPPQIQPKHEVPDPAPLNIATPPPVVRSALAERDPTMPARALLATPTPAAKTVDIPSSNSHANLSSRNIFREGDRGTSRFFRNENTLSVTSGKMQFSGSAVYLTSFSEKPFTETGSSFLPQLTDSLVTEDVVFVPQFAYTHENVTLNLGTSPLGGTVSPLPTATIRYADSNLNISIFNDSVTDSLLSYVGFTDVHTGKDMGRVMKAGTRFAWQDTFAEHWFYGGSVSGAYLYGANVRENTAVKAEAYMGRSFGRLAVGIYTSLDHFERDLNHFTFGHGGYYSPHLAAAASGFVSWEYKTDALRFKVDTGAGYLYEDIRSSARYYKSSGQGDTYKAESNHRFTTNSGLEAALSLGKNIEATASVRLLTSDDFYESRGGLGLQMSF